LMVLFVTAFFPQASRSKAKEKIFTKITRFIPYFFLLGIPGTLLFEYVVLKLYGPSYPIDWLNMLLFSLATVLTLLYSSYDWLMAAVGKRGVRVCMWGVVISGTANLILNYFLIPLLKIRGAILALIISYLLSLLFIVSQKHILLYQEE
jgi:O-antigen/teichoic acid export membrane protein